MLLLPVDRIEQKGPISVLLGTVQNELIRTGQDVTVVSRSGQRDLGMITAVMPNSPGLKEFDQGSVGKAVKVTVRRRQPTFPDAEIAALEKAATA